MIFSGLLIDWSKLKNIKKYKWHVTITLIFLYLIYPALQYCLVIFLVPNRQLQSGLLLASLTPIALVAPYFTKQVDGDVELAFILVIISTILFPLISPTILKLVIPQALPIELLPLFKTSILLTTVPVTISFVIAKYIPLIKTKLQKALGSLNMLSLTVLIYILWGTAVSKFNINYISWRDISILLGIMFFQDFGILLISKIIFKQVKNIKIAKTICVCLSMKNIAIAAGILLFYDPMAAIAPTVGFIAHAFLFNFITYLFYIKPIKHRI